MLYKLITYFNWIVVGILAFLVIAEALSPHKGGGDAAGRGIGQAIYYLAIIALVLLLILNLLPYRTPRFIAFGLVALPILYIQLMPYWREWRRSIRDKMEEAQPIFPEKERDQLARVIRDGEPEKLSRLLQTSPPALAQDREILGYAIGEATHTSYRPDEKRECLRLLFQAGASLHSLDDMDVPIYMAAADVGNAKLLRLLLEQGADANAVQVHFKRPILFEAIGSYQEPEASVRVLLEFGADPNTRAILDDDIGPVSPLFRAAQLERWDVCATLLERGADPAFKTATGLSFRALVDEANQNLPEHGYSRKADYERLKALLQERMLG